MKILKEISALPSSKSAWELRTEYQSLLTGSLLRIIDSCGEAGYDVERAKEKTENAVDQYSLSGALSVVHDRFLSAVESDDSSSIQRCLSVLETLCGQRSFEKIIGMGVDSWPYGELHESMYLESCREGYQGTYGSAFDGRPLSQSEYIDSRPELFRAISAIANYIPDAYDEFQGLVTDVALMRSDMMNAGSSTKSLGIMRVSNIKSGQDWTRYFENIIHECGHQFLNYLWYFDPLIENEDAGMFSSPLRTEPRPLSGIFHAYFVLARTIDGAARLKEQAGIELSSAYNNKKNDASFLQKFQDCEVTLAKNAAFTSVGGRLFEQCRKVVNDIR